MRLGLAALPVTEKGQKLYCFFVTQDSVLTYKLCTIARNLGPCLGLVHYGDGIVSPGMCQPRTYVVGILKLKQEDGGKGEEVRSVQVLLVG